MGDRQELGRLIASEQHLHEAPLRLSGHLRPKALRFVYVEIVVSKNAKKTHAHRAREVTDLSEKYPATHDNRWSGSHLSEGMEQHCRESREIREIVLYGSSAGRSVGLGGGTT